MPMSLAPPLNEREVFEQEIEAGWPAALPAVRFIFDRASAPLNTVARLREVFVEQDCVVRLLQDLRGHIPPEDLAPATTVNSVPCDVWCFFGFLLMVQGKW